jgi:hypothetical protein
MESKVEGKVEPAGFKVACLVDFSLNSRKAVERAVAMAVEKGGNAKNAELVLLHCMHG